MTWHSISDVPCVITTLAAASERRSSSILIWGSFGPRLVLAKIGSQLDNVAA